VLLLAVLEPGCSEAPDARDATREPPERIVLIVVDTLRRDHVSPYSDRVPTPHIDALARRGQTFPSASSSYHQTTMSMSALFTGHTPSIERGHDRERLDWTGETWCGLQRFSGEAAEPGCIPASVTTLAERLRDAGYWTLGITSNELLYRPGGYERGFDRWVEVRGTPVPAGRVNHAVQAELSKRPQDRLFLYVHYMDVHDYRQHGRSYAASVQVADQAVGRLLSILDAQGLMDGAVVVFTSDHGEHLKGEKHFVPANRGHSGSPSFETLLRVPLIVAPPTFDDTASPLRSDDLHRMLLELARAGASPPPDLEPDEVYLSERHFQTYRQGSWKSYRHRATGKHFLVDLAADPDERRSVHGAHPERLAEHAARIDDLARRLGAPKAQPRQLSPQDRARLQALGYEAAE